MGKIGATEHFQLIPQLGSVGIVIWRVNRSVAEAAYSWSSHLGLSPYNSQVDNWIQKHFAIYTPILILQLSQIHLSIWFKI